MKLVLVRHGEPDHRTVDARGYTGHGRDLAPLTAKGAEQAEAAAKSPLLQGAELIVSSPYTRAMQTAAVLSLRTGLEITVENDIHEWIPDLTFALASEEENDGLHRDYIQNRGEYPPGETRRWETHSMLTARLRCLDKYLSYGKIIVAAHGKVIRAITGERDIPYCSVREVEYGKGYKFYGFVG